MFDQRLTKVYHSEPLVQQQHHACEAANRVSPSAIAEASLLSLLFMPLSFQCTVLCMVFGRSMSDGPW